jgi:hypothetical protein
MNLKSKIISNAKIFNFFSIDVTIEFSENLIKNYGWVLKKRVDSLWIFEMMKLCLSHAKNEKCGLRKYVIVISKWKFKNRPP